MLLPTKFLETPCPCYFEYPHPLKKKRRFEIWYRNLKHEHADFISILRRERIAVNSIALSNSEIVLISAPGNALSSPRKLPTYSKKLISSLCISLKIWLECGAESFEFIQKFYGLRFVEGRGLWKGLSRDLTRK